MLRTTAVELLIKWDDAVHVIGPTEWGWTGLILGRTVPGEMVAMLGLTENATPHKCEGCGYLVVTPYCPECGVERPPAEPTATRPDDGLSTGQHP